MTAKQRWAEGETVVCGRRSRLNVGAAAAALVTLTCHVLTALPAADAARPTAPDGPLPRIDKAAWIWRGPQDSLCQVRTTFTLDEAPTAASILITADNGYELYINGALVGYDVGASSEIWSSVERFDITSRLSQGRNNVGIRAICLGGMRGLIAAIRIEIRDGKPIELVTGPSWLVALEGEPETYSHPEFVEGPEWTAARVLGPMGMAPWGKLVYAGSTGGRRATLPGSASLTKPGPDFSWPDGLAFLGDDCSVYVSLRGDAWGVCFRINGWSRAYTEFDIPCPSKIGRKLYILKPVGPGAASRLLVDAGRGAIGSPSVSYDGRSIYVAMAMDGESFFHIYRVPVDGGQPERLTDGPFHDIDPAELPDGRIVFTSTRIGSFEEYHNPPSRALFVMQPDSRTIQPITFTPTFDNEPKVMADGRIAFIRTDNFFDRAKVETQIHVIRPDGTDGLTEFGSDVGADYGVRLRALGYGSPAPLPDGNLACISSRGNFISSPGGSEPTFHVLPGGLGDLAPLPDGRLLATVLRPKALRIHSDVIAVIDPRDNKVVSVYESPTGSVHSPVFLGPRPRPPVVAGARKNQEGAIPGTTGYLFCQNARFTRKNKADWEQIRAIRVLGALALTTRSSHSHIVHAGHETVELGVVPIAPDGSFSIEVPADMPLALQAVDAEGRSELNEMSWIYVRPGERRSCLGCHHVRTATPPSDSRFSHALHSPPLKLVGQGEPHRFRGNNSGVTGMMDLQFERFRETASMNLFPESAGPLTTGRQEIAALVDQLRGRDEALRISASQRLGLFRDRSCVPALAEPLEDLNREVRVAAALALSSCGTRESVEPLLDALRDRDPIVSQAAAVALENLTAHAEPFQPFCSIRQRRSQAAAWRSWFRANSWTTIERSLIERISSKNRATRRRAIVALGHVGGTAARAALRRFVTAEKAVNPYPPFVKNNRTDRFTYAADSPLNPRTLQEAVRALGYLNDVESVPLLREILTANVDPKTANLYLAEAAVEALGRIATLEAEAALIETFGSLRDYIHYVGWYSDHPALYACHASPLHARIITALDAMGSTRTARIVPHLIRSVPTDPDRALFPENDAYEILVGRVIRRSGRSDATVDTCLALLGDPEAQAAENIAQAIRITFAAWAGTPAPDNRAAQMLSLLCRGPEYQPRIHAAYERYRAKPEDPISRPLGNPSWIPQRHWVLFYLGRALGNLGDPRSVPTLLVSLDPALNEARHGRPDPSQPNIHFLQLEYTPCWRAAAAWALGRIGDRRAVPVLLEVVGNLNNATDTRHAAAEALGSIADPESLGAIQRLAAGYPEVSTRRALLEACAALLENHQGGRKRRTRS
ncbi:MAG: HEAT repeat domain-containing protein [Phycisphaerales bacterium]|nr:MAG: HEAT repeat domain-containing protein [Phycisphaerales bacterium]